MSDDLIENTGPKILAQITISLVETGPGQTGTKVDQSCPDEITALGLLDKGGQILRMLWAQAGMAANAPKIVRAKRDSGRDQAAFSRMTRRG